jgi:hypothetical protein
VAERARQDHRARGWPRDHPSRRGYARAHSRDWAPGRAAATTSVSLRAKSHPAACKPTPSRRARRSTQGPCVRRCLSLERRACRFPVEVLRAGSRGRGGDR